MVNAIKTVVSIAAALGSFAYGYFLGKKAGKKEEPMDVTVSDGPDSEEEELPTVEQISQEMHDYADNLKTQQKLVFSSEVEVEESEETEDEEPEEEEVTVEEPDDGPYEPAHSESGDAYIITPEEMDNTNLHYIKEELKYFMKDKVLVTEDEGVVTDILAMIGEEAVKMLNKLAEESDGYYTTDTVCVRNDRIGSDFEIILMPGSYEDYFGLPEMEEDEDI